MKLFEVYSDLSSFSEKTDIYGDFAHILWEGHASKKTRNVPSPEIYIDRLGLWYIRTNWIYSNSCSQK